MRMQEGGHRWQWPPCAGPLGGVATAGALGFAAAATKGDQTRDDA